MLLAAVIISCMNLGASTCETYLQIHGILVDLALVLVIALGIVEHRIDIAQEVLHRLILLTFVFTLIHGQSPSLPIVGWKRRFSYLD